MNLLSKCYFRIIQFSTLRLLLIIKNCVLVRTIEVDNILIGFINTWRVFSSSCAYIFETKSTKTKQFFVTPQRRQ